jgi:hypothetical protein
MRWNVFNFNHSAYLEAWSELEGTPFSINVEHDLPLANINGSSHGLVAIRIPGFDFSLE